MIHCDSMIQGFRRNHLFHNLFNGYNARIVVSVIKTKNFRDWSLRRCLSQQNITYVACKVGQK